MTQEFFKVQTRLNTFFLINYFTGLYNLLNGVFSTQFIFKTETLRYYARSLDTEIKKLLSEGRIFDEIKKLYLSLDIENELTHIKELMNGWDDFYREKFANINTELLILGADQKVLDSSLREKLEAYLESTPDEENRSLNETLDFFKEIEEYVEENKKASIDFFSKFQKQKEGGFKICYDLEECTVWSDENPKKKWPFKIKSERFKNSWENMYKLLSNVGKAVLPTHDKSGDQLFHKKNLIEALAKGLSVDPGEIAKVFFTEGKSWGIRIDSIKK